MSNAGRTKLQFNCTMGFSRTVPLLSTHPVGVASAGESSRLMKPGQLAKHLHACLYYLRRCRSSRQSRMLLVHECQAPLLQELFHLHCNIAKTSSHIMQCQSPIPKHVSASVAQHIAELTSLPLPPWCPPASSCQASSDTQCCEN